MSAKIISKNTEKGWVNLLKLFITGCAKSGTTLLLRLFNYFKDVHVVYDGDSNEVYLEMLNQASLDFEIVIGKRKWNHILSYPLDDNTLGQQEKYIVDNDIKIINIIRDGRDVVLSDDKWVPPSRWISCIEQRKRFEHVIKLEVKYEDIIYHPDDMQDKISKKFNLEIEHKFSDYPNHLDEGIFTKKGGNLYTARPISATSIHKDLEKYKNLCSPKELIIFDDLLKGLGYI